MGCWRDEFHPVKSAFNSPKGKAKGCTTKRCREPDVGDWRGRGGLGGLVVPSARQVEEVLFPLLAR